MRGAVTVAAGWLVVAAGAGAVQIRGYDAARHDRFTGFPAAPVENAGFLHVAARFRGVGWWANGVNRQFALVSPRHFVCATHYMPTVGSKVRFAGAGGVVVEGTVAEVAGVAGDGGGGASDLALGRLAEGIDGGTGIVPFAWLNLGAEDAYRDASLMVFGWPARAGVGRLAGFADLSEPGTNTTRALRFDYREAAGGPDDAMLETGDSGSPTFVMAGGEPALVGVHSSVATEGETQANYDAFIPHYIAGLDQMLEPHGHRMRPAFLQPAVLTISSASAPAALRRAHPGRIDVEVANAGGVETGNVVLEVVFAPATAPDAIDAPGWVVEAGAAGRWQLRRARLAGGATGTVALEWDALPAAPALGGTVGHASDASPAASVEVVCPLLPSYAEWAAGLTDADPGADPDRDGLANLVEYAFGGDPQAGALVLAGSHPLGVVPAWQAGTAGASFPWRTDAELRGLSYFIEWSATMAPGSWSGVPPPGLATEAGGWEPPVAGFERRVVSWPAGAGRLFCRVGVELDEGGLAAGIGIDSAAPDRL